MIIEDNVEVHERTNEGRGMEEANEISNFARARFFLRHFCTVISVKKGSTREEKVNFNNI